MASVLKLSVVFALLVVCTSAFNFRGFHPEHKGYMHQRIMDPCVRYPILKKFGICNGQGRTADLQEAEAEQEPTAEAETAADAEAEPGAETEPVETEPVEAEAEPAEAEAEPAEAEVEPVEAEAEPAEAEAEPAEAEAEPVEPEFEQEFEQAESEARSGIRSQPGRPPICGRSFFHCSTSGECVPAYQVCDGVKHCRDGTDEARCGAFGRY